MSWKEACALWLLVAGQVVLAQPNIQQLQCQDECGRYFSPHTIEFEEINPSYNSCAHGCDFFRVIKAQGHDQPINILQNCNDSCDERYVDDKINACKAGCGFSYDAINSISDPSTNSGPIGGHQQTKPLIMTISLPRLMDQFSRMMPGLDNFFGSSPRLDVQPQQSFINNDLDSVMESFMNGINSPMMMDETDRMLDSEAHMMEDDLTAPGFPVPGMFGRKDDDDVPPSMTGLFSSLNDHMSRMMSLLPQMTMTGGLSSLNMQSSNTAGGGEISIFRSRPGFQEEKHYKFDENGVITEVTEEPKESERLMMPNDGLEHRNPLDIEFSGNDVEIFDPQSMIHIENKNEAEELPMLAEQLPLVVETIDKEPIKEKPQEETVNDPYPFLAIMKNDLEENERLSQRFANIFKSYQYPREISCNDLNLKWSDWVACVHDRLGVPRWFTAATIALGIIFTVWLCLVIPSTAPKRKLRTLIIRGAKPSAAAGQSKELTAAEAKELEANGGGHEPVIAVIKVDLPPSYADVTPGSPAPSYKSNMVPPPGSPAPSYKSVEGKGEYLDVNALKAAGEEKKDLEPVHAKGDNCVA